ncbi:MAG: glycine-rich protein [Rickettsiales bacterium]|nr:glycine-rich protein [Rickettsiales bacterium]
MNKKYFLKELKDYCSIFASFAFLLMLFSNNMSFATTCAETYEGSNVRGTLDHCKTLEVDYLLDTTKIDIDGNQPAECKSTDLTYNPYTSPDYYYDSSNKYCLIWGLGISITYAAASIAANIACNRFTPFSLVSPDDIADKSKKIAMITKKITGFKSVLQTLKAAKSVLVKSAAGVAVSILTDPIITLQIEFGIDAAVLGLYTTLNGINCAYWTSQASAELGLDPTADTNATTACAMTTACAIALGTLTVLSQTLIFATTGVLYSEANDQINKAKLCGYDWEGRVFTEYDVENFDSKELYPQTGFFANSYSYKLKKCFRDGATKALTDFGVNCAEVTEGDGYCELDSSICDNINITSRTIKNRLYREILYDGKEFKIATNYGSGQCIDPRPENQKGFKGVEQRYYFRGMDSAQYACKRFKYKNQGCVLADGIEISATTAAEEESKNSLCKQAFEDAYNCCKNRAALGVCIYDVTTDENITDSSSGRSSNNNTMCLRSLDSTVSPEACQLSTGHGVIADPKFLAFTSQEDAMKICIRNVNYCPYSYNVDGGTAIENLFCNGDYSCTGAKSDVNEYDFTIPSIKDKQKIWSNNQIKTPTNAYGETKNYCTYNSHCTELGDTGDSDFEDMTDNKFLPKVCSDFIGDSQNLPVPVSLINISVYDTIKKAFAEKGIDINDLSSVNDGIESLTNAQVNAILASTILIPQVANSVSNYGFSKAALKNIISSINKPVISGMDFSLGEYRGFTAPIVQCFKETLYNMFNNKAGQSFCKSDTEEVNAEGLCGTDTFGPPESIDPDKYIYMIGEDLPEDSNIFYKLQSRLQLLIKLAAIFAIIIIGLNFLLKGELDIFGEVKKPKAMIAELMKFAIVFYFAVGNAWQTKFYELVDNASEYLYYKVFDLSLLNYAGYKNIDTQVECTQNIITTTCEDRILDLQNITFTNDGTFVISPNATGVKLEVWGGSGGANGGATVAKGGYSYGTIELPSTALNLNAGNSLYVKVGIAGDTWYGGGATDVRLNTGSLTCNSSSDPRIIVAGGAGGNGAGIYTYSEDHYLGGAGGGGNNSGNNGLSVDTTAFGSGGTLIAGGLHGCHSGYCGSNGTCGIGGNPSVDAQNLYDDIYGAGGNGWYGGGGASGGWSGGSGGGGSGYVNSALIDSGGSVGVHDGNGYAKILSYQSSTVCYSYSNITKNFVIEDLSIFPDSTMPSSTYCTTDNVANIETCYSSCTEEEKKDPYGNKEYKWDKSYDGCYFGDSYYPNGKHYLAIFDSLDCKLMNYFNYAPDTDLPGILHMLLLSILWSPLALIVVCLGFLFFIILLSIVIKIFYIFLMSLFAVNLLIYISPIVFPSLLFKKYKNMFGIWLDSLMGYILQVAFVVIFAGLVIGNLENLGLGDAKYINHDPATGRLPVLDCSNSDTSLLCIFNVNISKGEQPAFGIKLYKFLGLGPLVGVAKSINSNFIGTVITLIKACLILYVLLQFLKKIPNFALDLANVKALLDTNSKLEPGNMMKELKNKSEIALKAMKYGGMTAAGGIKKGLGKANETRKEFGGAVKELKDSKKKKSDSSTKKSDDGSSGAASGTGKSSSSSGGSSSSSALPSKHTPPSRPLPPIPTSKGDGGASSSSSGGSSNSSPLPSKHTPPSRPLPPTPSSKGDGGASSS